jgi:hypothetical protein
LSSDAPDDNVLEELLARAIAADVAAAESASLVEARLARSDRVSMADDVWDAGFKPFAQVHERIGRLAR